MIWFLSSVQARSKRRHVFSGDDYVTNICLAPERRMLLTGYSNGNILFWSTDRGELWGALKAHDDKLIRMTYSEEQNMIITTGFNAQLKVWKMKEKKKELLI